MLIDLLARRAVGLFTAETAGDVPFWERTAIPILLGIISPAVGITPIHAACLIHENGPLLISGESGSGKSTLTLALTKIGLGYISDDWMYVSGSGDRLQMWSPLLPIKLLPDATRFFPEMDFPKPHKWMNGEDAIQLTMFDANTGKARLLAEPRWIVFLERSLQPAFEIHPVNADWAAHELSRSLEHLPDCLGLQREAQLATIRNLARCECWHLRCAGPPTEIAEKLSGFCRSTHFESAPIPCEFKPLPCWPDLLRRRSPAVFSRTFHTADATISLHSNNPGLLECDFSTLSPSTGNWTLTFLAEDSLPRGDDVTAELRWGSLVFVLFGHSGFLALDKVSEFGLCCVSEDFFSHDEGRRRLFLSISNLLEQGIHEPQIG